MTYQEFLDTKKVNADEDMRLATISTGLVVPSKFFELARDNAIVIFVPHTVEREYGST